MRTSLKNEIFDFLKHCKRQGIQHPNLDTLLLAMKGELKYYEITSICKDDLQDRFKESQIKRFTNSDMEYLASKMGDAYMDYYWEEMDIIGHNILERKDGEKKNRYR